MVKPAASMIRQLARKKRESSRGAEEEVRKKRREEGTSSVPASSGEPVVSLPRGGPPSEIPRDAPPPVPRFEEVGGSAKEVVADPGSAAPKELPIPVDVPTEAGDPTKDDAGAPGVVPDRTPVVVESDDVVEVGLEAGEVGRAPEVRVGGLTKRAERALLKRVGLTLEEFDQLLVPDEPRAVDLKPYQDKKALEDDGLAEAILKATLLPKDWEKTQSQPLETLARTVFSDLLRVVHSASALSEGVESALDINRRAMAEMARIDKDLITNREASKAWKEIAVGREVEIKSLRSKVEAMGKAMAGLKAEVALREEFVKQLGDDKARMMTSFDARLSGKDHEINKLMLSAQEARSKADSVEVALDDTRRELQKLSGDCKSQLRAKDGEIASLKLSAERAVADYKSSEAFGEEVAEAGASSYDVGFRDGLKQVKKLHPELDLSAVEPPEDDDDEDVAEAPTADPARGLSGEADDLPPAPEGLQSVE